MVKVIIACVGVLASASASAARAQTGGEEPSAIGYSSVDEAYTALRAKAGVTFSKTGDWIIANDIDKSIWSFTPANHPAHPSVGRRRLLSQDGGGYRVETKILCQAQKAACDSLYADYQLLDRRMMESLRAGK